MKTCRLPSAFNARRLISAIRSLEPGGGRLLQNFFHSSSEARSAKDEDGITNGPGVTETIRPSKIDISQEVWPTSSRKTGRQIPPSPDQARVGVDPLLQRFDHFRPHPALSPGV